MKRCTHPTEIVEAVERVRACFPSSTDLLSKQYQKRQRATASEGFCSVASESVWFEAQKYGYRGRNASWRSSDGERFSHWWLVSPDDCVLDPTSDQFSPEELRKIYAIGKPGGFPGIRRPEGVPTPSARARTMRERAGLGRAPRRCKPVTKKAAMIAAKKLRVPYSDEFMLGIKTEREHADLIGCSTLKAAKIARAHLLERGDYYTRLHKYIEGLGYVLRTR